MNQSLDVSSMSTTLNTVVTVEESNLPDTTTTSSSSSSNIIPPTKHANCVHCNKLLVIKPAAASATASPTSVIECSSYKLSCYRKVKLTSTQETTLKTYIELGTLLSESLSTRNGAKEKKLKLIKANIPGLKIKEVKSFLCTIGASVKGTKIINVLEGMSKPDGIKRHQPTKQLKPFKESDPYPDNLYEINIAGLKQLSKQFGLPITAKGRGHLMASGEFLRQKLTQKIQAHVDEHGTDVVEIDIDSEEEEEEDAAFLVGTDLKRKNTGTGSTKVKKQKPSSHKNEVSIYDNSWRSSGHNKSGQLNALRRLKQAQKVEQANELVTLDFDKNKDGAIIGVKWIGLELTHQDRLNLIGFLATQVVESKGESNETINFISSRSDVEVLIRAADAKKVPHRQPPDATIHLNDSIVIVTPPSSSSSSSSSE